MFDIFKKRSKIYVDAFTWNSAIHDYFPIVPAKDAVPEWWKKLPSFFDKENEHGMLFKQGTMKQCDGFIDLYKVGLILPLWSDLVIQTNDTGGLQYQFSAGEAGRLEFHMEQQLGPEFKDYIHTKILSPWMISESTNVRFNFFPAIWNNLKHLNDIHIVPGNVSYHYQKSTHINMLLPKKEARYELNAGQAMAQIIPMTDKDIVLKTHLVTIEEYDRMMMKYGYMSSFIGKYKKNIKRLKGNK